MLSTSASSCLCHQKLGLRPFFAIKDTHTIEEIAGKGDPYMYIEGEFIVIRIHKSKMVMGTQGHIATQDRKNASCL